MDAFLAKHADAIRGVLSCFDRVLFRGSLPLMSGDAMADFLKRKQVKRPTLKTFLLTPADRVKKPALSMAAAAKRPHQYLSGPARKEDLAPSAQGWSFLKPAELGYDVSPLRLEPGRSRFQAT